MKSKQTIIVLAISAGLGACGGGDDNSDGGGSSQTGSNQQTRTVMNEAAAISFVEGATAESSSINQIDKFLAAFAPRPAATRGPNQKDVVFVSCSLISEDPNCKGQFRVEAEFPATEPQQSFRAGSTLIIDWEGIEGGDFSATTPINGRSTFNFQDEISLISRYSGQLELVTNQTTPAPFSSSNTYRMDQLTVNFDSAANGFVIDGKYVLNPNTGLPVDTSETITFSNWAVKRNKRKAGAQATLYSTKYSASTPTVLTPKFRITVTVVSSDESRTEYQVFGKADADDLGTTRTVIGTIDSNGRIAYTAS